MESYASSVAGTLKKKGKRRKAAGKSGEVTATEQWQQQVPWILYLVVVVKRRLSGNFKKSGKKSFPGGGSGDSLEVSCCSLLGPYPKAECVSGGRGYENREENNNRAREANREEEEEGS